MKNQISLVSVVVGLSLAMSLVGCTKAARVSGPGGAQLTLAKPSAVSIERGGMAKADLSITRTNVTGDVSIRFSDLPNGVEVIDASSRIVGDKGSYTLRASDGADLVENSVAEVTATAQNGIAVTQAITISVSEKK